MRISVDSHQRCVSADSSKPGQYLSEGLGAGRTASSGSGLPVSAKDGDQVWPLLVDKETAAAMLGIGTRSLFRLTKSGEIPAVKIGTSVRYSPQTLATWVQSRLSPAQAAQDQA